MSSQQRIQVGVPDADHGLVADTVRQAAGAVFTDARLLSRAVVELVDEPVGRIHLQGEPLPISGRRMEQAVLAGSGRVRDPEDGRTPRELALSRFAGADGATKAAVVGSLVDTALRSALPVLVRAERFEIARRLARGPCTVEAVADAVGLAAEVGVNPVVLDDDGVRGAPDEAYAAAEWMVQRCLERDPADLVVEAHAATLRRLTTGPEALGAELITGSESSGPFGLVEQLHRYYGVLAPRVRLRVAHDCPPEQVRFSFGCGGRSAAHLVLPGDVVVVTAAPELLEPSGAPYLDPFLGSRWSAIGTHCAHLAPGRVLHASALVINALLAEMATRLSLWAPRDDALSLREVGLDGGVDLPATAAAVRRLLASRVSLRNDLRLKEAAILLAAEGERRIDRTELGLRAFLGRAVVAPTTASTADGTVVEVLAAVAEDAAATGSARPLLEKHPELAECTQDIVLAVPGRWRHDVEQLLKPLNDVVLVAATEEYALLPVAPTRMPGPPH